MDTIFYGELKNAIAAIAEFDKGNAPVVVDERRQTLVVAVAGVVELSHIARKEGILQLEDILEDMAQEDQILFPCQSYLQQMIELVVDCTAPEVIREICMLQFAGRQLAGYDALIYLIYLWGTLCIQAGENPIVVEKYLRVMLPEEVDCIYEERKPERGFVPKTKEPQERDNRSGERIAPGEQFELRILEALLKEMNDSAVEQLLQNLDNTGLAVVMKGMDGETCDIIFQNMTERRANLIASDLQYMGPVRLKDVRETARHIIEQIFRLESGGLIYLKENGLARIFMQLLRENDKDVERMKQLRSRSSELEKLFEEYRTYRKRMFGE